MQFVLTPYFYCYLVAIMISFVALGVIQFRATVPGKKMDGVGNTGDHYLEPFLHAEYFQHYSRNECGLGKTRIFGRK